MDPDTLLRQLLAPAKQVQRKALLADERAPDDGGMTVEAAEMAAMVENLDRWLAKGGFLPKRWTKASKGGAS